jgi:two-component system cell cycle response regulator CpdR
MAKILIAEDDMAMRRFISMALQRAGHSVSVAVDGLDAMEYLNAPDGHLYDLLLTDIVMPGMDGIELCARARNLFPDLKTMFITGFSVMAVEYTHASQAHEENDCDDFEKGREIMAESKLITKPFHLNDLVQQIEGLLNAA